MRRRMHTTCVALASVVFALSSSAVRADDNDLFASDFAEVTQLLQQIKDESRLNHEPSEGSQGKPPSFPSVHFDDKTEASVNRPVHENLFETDIVLNLPQAKQILADIRSEGKRRRRPRQAQPTLSSFWTALTISYRFQYDDPNWRNYVRAGIKHIESETCMRFQENGPGADYLQYIRGSGCWSNVGRQGGKQQVSIGFGCESLGIVAHETLHALGLWHEQSRTDRDKYIGIEYKYIFPGTQSNFEKRTPATSDNMGQPYDLGSVMHYGSKAFSTQYEKYTITTNDAHYQQTIGQRVGISYKDAKMINLRYCSRVCPLPLACQYGGYTDPNKCSQCKCPEGFGGQLCDQVPASSLASCRGSFLQAYPHYYILRSPSATPGARCYWKIRANPGQRIEVLPKAVSFPCDDACISYVELKYKRDKVATGARLCCNSTLTKMVSEDSEVTIIFHIDPSIEGGYRGFELWYRIYSPTPATGATKRRGGGKQPGRRRGGKKPAPKPKTKTHQASTPDPDATEEVAPTEEVTTEEVTEPTPEVVSTHEPEPEHSGFWSSWGGWSGCTAPCGGCGQRKRVRACYGGNKKCPGIPYELEPCGEHVCPIPNKKIRCQGRILLPCDLLSQLDFGTVRDGSGEHAVVSDPSKKPKGNETATLDHLEMTPKNAEVLRRVRREATRRRLRRFVDGNLQLDNVKIYCEKRFTYNCPTSLVTISMDWKNARDTIHPGDGRLCCPGYYAASGVCVKQL